MACGCIDHSIHDGLLGHRMMYHDGLKACKYILSIRYSFSTQIRSINGKMLRSFPLSSSAATLKATSPGSLKLAQNIRFNGATSLTSHICTSPSVSTSSPGFISYPSCALISLQILIPSSLLSSLFVLKQYTCILGNLASVYGLKSSSRPAYRPMKEGKNVMALAGRLRM